MQRRNRIFGSQIGMSTIGNRVEERLNALEKSQQWLADKVGMKQQGVGSIIKGSSRRPRKLREIARALQTSQEYLLGETDEPAPIPLEQAAFSGYSRLSPAGKQAVSALIVSLRETESTAKRRSSPKPKDRAKRP